MEPAAMLFTAYCCAIGVLGFGTITFGDAAAASVVAGIFSTINLFLNALLLRKTQEVKAEARVAARAAHGPRRFVYNDSGRVIGSVPEPPRGDLEQFEPLRESPEQGVRWSDGGKH